MFETTIRNFVRDFAAVRRRADAGEVVRIKGRARSYILKAQEQERRGLVAACADMAPRKGGRPGMVESPDAWAANR